MRFLLVILCCLVLLVSATGIDTPSLPCAERPIINVPVSLRQTNWLGSQNEGSCPWASLITGLNWEGEYERATMIRKNYGNGEYPETFTAKLKAAGIPFVATYREHNIAFLEEALARRLPVLVAVRGGTHMVVLAHLDSNEACLIDNNKPSKNLWVSRDEFLMDWIGSGSWAVVPLYPPVPPLAY